MIVILCFTKNKANEELGLKLLAELNFGKI